MIYLMVILASTAIACQAVKRLPLEQQAKFLLYTCIGNYCFLYFYKGMLWLAPNFDFNIWLDLPLALCNIISLLIIFAVKYRNQTLLGFCFIFGIGAGLTALITPVDGFAAVSLFSVEILYYIYHGVLLCLSVMLLTTGMYRPKLRHLLQSGALYIALSCVAHGINLLLIATVEPEANYFFTFGLPGNPLSDWSRSIIDMDVLMSIPLITPWLIAMLCFFQCYLRLCRFSIDDKFSPEST